MARRGSFRRSRRGGGSMTTLVMQLMKEQRAAEDKAIFDAYQNGGLYKGKPVTDARILEHMQSRRDGFDKADPLWDQWNNQVIQQKFSIGEQKIGLAFQQGKVGAGAVASYYRNALKGIPKDSAFYRDVAGRAAQWAKSAAGAARGRARGRATAGMREKLNKQLEMQQKYLGLEAALTAYAKREGLISGTQKLTDADATELQAMFDRGIYAGDDRITFADFTSAAKDHYTALGAEIDTRLALGQQAVEARNKRSKFLGETMVRLNAVDERAQYEMAREDWLSNVAAAGNDPYAVAAANEKYTAALVGIHKNASQNVSGVNATDPEFIGGLQNEYELMTTGKASGKTVYDLYDMVDVGGNSQQQAEAFAAFQADMDRLDTGKAYYGQSEPGGPMAVVPWPSGPQANNLALGLDDSLQPSLQTINGQKRVVYMKGEAVSASVLLDANDQVIEAAGLTAGELRAGLASGTLRVESGGNVGYVFTNPESGKVKYGVTDPVNGTMMFTDENPWSSATVNVAGVGTTVFSTAAKQTEKGDFTPDMTGVLTRTIDIDTADPLLSDGPVSSKDLMALIESGTQGVSLTDEQFAKYQMRLAREEKNRQNANVRQEVAGAEGYKFFGDSQVTSGGGGDLRTGILEGMQSVADVAYNLFGGKSPASKELGAPPSLTAPKLMAPWQGLKPDGTPKDVVELSPEMPDRYAPEPEVRNYSPHQPAPKPTAPKLTPDPRKTPGSGVLEY